ncbi:polymer-forming cytoskeletal protein [Curvibacter sp. HBC61]|uniref:Polymer-forming cytoskeletal protein n=1 Tax=Curvibacter cyanobacteriorum TaxID=3026422 RepID=A0ABT5N3T6_9BURK|nr:polymer-forming cytoskeletal protein [Curvibacter sp. HBC61]MDD0840974.1 polymer-forming cytoskeletal protein [Curvibacter sp. HBC61]
MFAKKKQPPIKSLIAQGSRIDGNITFAEGLRVDGDVVGDVRVDESQPSLLVISETATVIGAVYADHVIINGRVQGPVHARELLELQPRARIEGDIYYKALEMHQGAVVAGMLCPAVQMDEKPLLSLTANSH